MSGVIFGTVDVYVTPTRLSGRTSLSARVPLADLSHANTQSLSSTSIPGGRGRDVVLGLPLGIVTILTRGVVGFRVLRVGGGCSVDECENTGPGVEDVIVGELVVDPNVMIVTTVGFLVGIAPALVEGARGSNTVLVDGRGLLSDGDSTIGRSDRLIDGLFVGASAGVVAAALSVFLP